jgi:hypothetical protein
MKAWARFSQAGSIVISMSFLLVTGAAPLMTLRNSSLSVPVADIAGAAAGTNLVGANFLISSVAPTTAQGGHASLPDSQQWVRRYNGGTGSSQSGAYAMILRADGSVVVAGYSSRPGSDYDFASVCYAANGTPLWTNRYDGPGHGGDTARYLAATTNGDVWVAGESMQNATNTTLTEVVLIKYASNGVPAWTNRYGSFASNGAYATGLVVDGAGNTYVKYSASFWSGSFGTPVEDAILKCNPSGIVVWIKHYLRSAPDSGQDLHDLGPMALDDAGNLFLGGSTGGNSYTTGSSIMKFSGDGGALWTNHIAWPFVDGIYLLSLDRQGNIIAAGQRWTDFTRVYVVMKYSKDGATLWTNALAGPGYDGGNVPQVVPDLAGDVFVIGGSQGTISSGLYQVMKVSSNGVPLWTNQIAVFGPTNGILSASTMDSAGNLYLGGYARVQGGYDDYVTVKFSNSGQALWTNRFNGTGNLNDYGFTLAVDREGDVYVSGESQASIGNREFATVKYSDLLVYAPPKDFIGLDSVSGVVFDESGTSAPFTLDVLIVPGSFQFNLTGANLTQAGMHLLVEGAPGTNMVVLETSTDFSSWQPILSNSPINGAVQFLDTAASSLSPRFYRAFQQQ